MPNGAVPPQQPGQQPVPQPVQQDLASISVSARIAPFWRDMPKLWFSQFEAILAPQKLGQEAKFDLVISKLGKEELNGVSDLIEAPAGERTYTALKARLITSFQESADSHFNRLVKELELGDQKPSQLHRKMAEAGRNSGVAEDTVKKLWLQRLPTAVRTVLVVSEDAKLENLAAMADKIMETLRHGVVAEITSPSVAAEQGVNAELLQEFRSMALEVRQLRNEINEIRSQSGGTDRQRGSWNRSRSRSRRASLDPNHLCRYHFRFRERARQCYQPCAWARLQQQAAQVAPPFPGQPPQGPAYPWQPPAGN